MNHVRSYSSDNSAQYEKSNSNSSLTKNANGGSMGSSPIFRATSNSNIEERKSSMGMDKSKSRSLLHSLTNLTTINLSSIPNLTTALPPTPAMHWKKIDASGKAPPRCLRGHTMCMIDEKIYIFGGCDNKVCYNDLYVFDADTSWWMHCKTNGTPPAPCRAHSCVTIDKKIYFFGGGDGPTYYNDLYILDTQTLTWYKPNVGGDIPGARRAHAMWTYNKKIYIFAGGDGSRALNDVYALSISPPSSSFYNNTISSVVAENSPRFRSSTITGVTGDSRSPIIGSLSDRGSVISGGGNSNNNTLTKSMARNTVIGNSSTTTSNNNNNNNTPTLLDYIYTWTHINTTGKSPSPRGYHTSNIVGSKVIVFGGSDGHECFNDIHILDLKTNHWSRIDADQPIPRLSHSSTQVGSYLFIIGGHDGMKYSRDVLLLNLVTMNWETRKVYGKVPSGRGYHTAVLYDSRIYVFGGYDGHHVFNEMYALELSACAYLPQITDFEVAEMVE
ncbi:galactose oxidase [Neocallimastix sp. 'constans']|jgi:N-acetylneuraminic acid mutarotase